MQGQGHHLRVTLTAGCGHLLGMPRMGNHPEMCFILRGFYAISPMTSGAGKLMRRVKLDSRMAGTATYAIGNGLLVSIKGGILRCFGADGLIRPPAQATEKIEENREQAFHSLDTVA